MRPGLSRTAQKWVAKAVAFALNELEARIFCDAPKTWKSKMFRTNFVPKKAFCEQEVALKTSKKDTFVAAVLTFSFLGSSQRPREPREPIGSGSASSRGVKAPWRPCLVQKRIVGGSVIYPQTGPGQETLKERREDPNPQICSTCATLPFTYRSPLYNLKNGHENTAEKKKKKHIEKAKKSLCRAAVRSCFSLRSKLLVANKS